MTEAEEFARTAPPGKTYRLFEDGSSALWLTPETIDEARVAISQGHLNGFWKTYLPWPTRTIRR